MQNSSSKKPKQQKSEELYSLTDNSLNVPGGQTIQLTDREGCLKIFDCYFPDFSKKLTTVPKIDRIDGGVLYGHADSNGNYVAEVSTDINQESGYKGEIMDFYSNCVGKLSEAHGLLIHSYNEKIQRSIFTNSKKRQFETDWVYANNDKLVVIEVGRKLSGDKPMVIENKINQMAKSSEPELKNIVNSILKDKETTESEKAVDSVNFTFQCLVCLTNISLQELNNFFKNPAKNKIVKQVNEKWFFLTKETVDFMKLGEQENAFIYQVEGPEGAKTAVPSISLQRFFSNNTKRQPHDAKNDGKYLNAVLATGALIFDMNKPEVRRFYEGQLNYLMKLVNSNNFYQTVRKLAKKIGKEETFILSPQQLEVLQWNPKKLVIIGDAGSGKTTMLFIKLMLLHEELKAETDNMEKVVFYIPPQKTMFIDYVNRFIEQHCRPGFVKIVTNDYDLFNFGRRKEQPVVLVDEIYQIGSSFQWSLYNSFSTIWICGLKGNAQMWEPNNPCNWIFLKTLFRSAFHIAACGQFLRNRLCGSSQQKTEMFDCFASDQTEIEIHILNSLTSIKENIKIEKQAVFLVGYSEIEFREVFGNAVNLIPISFKHIEKGPYFSAEIDYHFTGVEYDEVVLIIGPKCSKMNFSIGPENCLELTYQVLTRSVKSFQLVIPDIFKRQFTFITKVDSSYFRLHEVLRRENVFVLTTRHFETLLTLSYEEILDIVTRHGSKFKYNHLQRFSHLIPERFEELLRSLQDVILLFTFSWCKDKLYFSATMPGDSGELLIPVVQHTHQEMDTNQELWRLLGDLRESGDERGFFEKIYKEQVTRIVVDESMSQFIDYLYSTEVLGVKSLEELVYALEKDEVFTVLVMNYFIPSIPPLKTGEYSLISYSNFFFITRIYTKHSSSKESLDIVGDPQHKLVLKTLLKLIYRVLHPWNPLFSSITSSN